MTKKLVLVDNPSPEWFIRKYRLSRHLARLLRRYCKQLVAPGDVEAPVVQNRPRLIVSGTTATLDLGSATGRPVPTSTSVVTRDGTALPPSGNTVDVSTAGTYLLTVTWTNLAGTAVGVSDPHVTEEVVVEAPVLVNPPVINGDTVVGSTLTLTPATWLNAEAEDYGWQYSFDQVEWLDYTEVTSTTLVVPVDALELHLRAVCTAANLGGTTTAYSAVVGPVTAAVPEDNRTVLFTGNQQLQAPWGGVTSMGALGGNFVDRWTGPTMSDFVQSGDLRDHWELNNHTRNSAYDVLLLTEATPVPEPGPDAVESLQYLYYLAREAKASGAQVILYKPYVGSATAARTERYYTYAAQWLSDHLELTVPIVPGQEFATQALANGETDEVAITKGLSGLVYAVVTGRRYPGVLPEEADLDELSWDIANTYAEAGLGGATVHDPVLIEDPLPFPEGIVPRAKTLATDRLAGDGHSLTDAWIHTGAWPQDFRSLRNSLGFQPQEHNADGLVFKSTIPGSPLGWRLGHIGATEPSPFCADPSTFAEVTTVEAGPGFLVDDANTYATRNDTLTYWLEYLELCRVNNVRVNLWSIWPQLDGWVGHPTYGATWGQLGGFRQCLSEYGRQYKYMADYGAWKLRQLNPGLPEDYRIWVFPAHLWWERVYDAVADGLFPGVSDFAGLFHPGDVDEAPNRPIHPSALAGYGLACLAFSCHYQVNLSEESGVYIPDAYTENGANGSFEHPAVTQEQAEFLWALAWEVATDYEPAGLGGTLGAALEFDPLVDDDPLVDTSEAPAVTRQPSVSPTNPSVGNTVTIDWGTASGNPAPTQTRSLTLNGVAQLTGSTFTAQAGTYVLGSTWSNGVGADAVTTTVTLTVEEPVVKDWEAHAVARYKAADWTGSTLPGVPAAMTPVGAAPTLVDGALRFNGTSNVLTSTADLDLSGKTVLFVAKAGVPSAAQQSIMSMSGTRGTIQLEARNNPAGTFTGSHRAGSGYRVGTTQVTPSSSFNTFLNQVGKTVVYAALYTAGELRLWAGEEAGQVSLLIDQTRVVTTLRLGAASNTSSFAPMDFYEWVILDTTEPSVVRDAVAHLGTKYSASMPRVTSLLRKDVAGISDSIGAGVGATGTNDFYRQTLKHFVATRTTNGFAGAQVSPTGLQAGVGDGDRQLAATFSNVTANPAVFADKGAVFASYGTNDYGASHGGVPLGTTGDTTAETFNGALNVGWANYLTNSPEGQVLFLFTPVPRFDLTAANTAGHVLLDYVVALRNFVTRVNSPRLRLVELWDCGLLEAETTDGLHPNNAGHARMAAYAWPQVFAHLTEDVVVPEPALEFDLSWTAEGYDGPTLTGQQPTVDGSKLVFAGAPSLTGTFPTSSNVLYGIANLHGVSAPQLKAPLISLHDNATWWQGPNFTLHWNGFLGAGKYIAEDHDNNTAQPVEETGAAAVIVEWWTDGTTVNVSVNGATTVSTTLPTALPAMNKFFMFGNMDGAPNYDVVALGLKLGSLPSAEERTTARAWAENPFG